MKHSTTPTTAETSGKGPVERLRIGRISASVFENEGKNGVFHSVRFERRYQDQDEKWQSSGSFNFDDLLILGKLADQAHDAILVLKKAE